MSRRFPHIAFDPERIRPFLGDRQVLSYQLLAGGAINSNYRIQVTGGEVYLLRLYSRGSPALEQYAMSFVKEVLPVPDVLHAGDGWAVMRFLPGEQLRGAPEAAFATGRALAQIGQVQFASSGAFSPGGGIEPFPFGGFEGFVNQCLDNLEVQRWLGPDLIQGVQRLLRREAVRYSELDQESRLVHGDFNPTNLLVSDGRVTGVLDWEFAHSGTPYMDIGNLLRNLGPEYDETVARGLSAGGMNLPDDWRERAALADLGSHLEFLTSAHSDDFKRQCVRRVEALLQ
jgi:aminoglycoside phosphotransferase (APT) family kinase protein